MHYYGCIMQTPTIQITVRGLDAATKSALAKKAAQKGISLNKYALESLKQVAGTDSSEERYRRLMAVIDKYRISSQNIKAADEAIAWANKASKIKQKRDDRVLGF